MPEQLRFSQEELEMIEDYSACNYRPQQIAKVMGYKKVDFMATYENHKSLLRHHYDKGRLEAKFVLDQKALELAKAGNQTARQIYDKAAEKTRIDNLKSAILFGGEPDDYDEEEQD